MFEFLQESITCRACLRSDESLELISGEKCITLINEILGLKVPWPGHVRLCRQCWHCINKMVRFRNDVRRADALFTQFMEKSKLGEAITTSHIDVARTKLNNENLRIHKTHCLDIQPRKVERYENVEHGVINSNDINIETIIQNTIPKIETDEIEDKVKVELEGPILDEEIFYVDPDYTWDQDDDITLQNIKTEQKNSNLANILSLNFNEPKRKRGRPRKSSQNRPENNKTKSKVMKLKEENGTESVRSKRKRLEGSDRIRTIVLSREEQLKELKDSFSNPKYLEAVHKCQYCAKVFNFEDTYKDHMKRHDESYGPFVCDICHIRNVSEFKAISHSQRHELLYECMECGEHRKMRRNALEHYTIAHGTAGPKACHCGLTFWKYSQLRQHRSKHQDGEKRLACEHCGKTFKNKDTLRVHMLCHSEQPDKGRPHVCPQCPARFHSVALVKLHQAKHDETQIYYCVECDKHFKTPDTLKQHLKMAAPHATPDDFKHVCDTCGNKYASKRSLEKHTYKTHLKVKNFNCDVCQKSFYQRWSLTTHKKTVHEGWEKPRKHHCTTCGKVFKSTNMLKAHIRTHTGERPYVCGICGATFSQSGSMHTHNKLVHLKIKRPPQKRRNFNSHKEFKSQTELSIDSQKMDLSMISDLTDQS